MNFYDYPPSEHIRRYEPFEPNSHFYVRGKCCFEDKKYSCDFEVAYTLSGEIYVICYLDTMSHHELFGIPILSGIFQEMYIPKEESISVDFSGLDMRRGVQVHISQATSIYNGMDINGNPPVFVASSFELTLTNKHYSFSPPSTNSINIDFEVLNINPSMFPDRGLLPFDIGGSHFVYLLRVTGYSNRSTSEENSVLRIPRKSVPLGWNVEDIADIWCSAISLATGRDIRWITKQRHTRRIVTHKFKRRSNIIRNKSTYGVIASQYNFWDDENVLAFISNIFDSIRKKKLTVDAVRAYSRIMWHFVEYQLLTARSEDQARLITTTVEELLTRWETYTNNIPTAVVSENEANQMWNNLKQNWLPTLNVILGTLTKQRQQDISNRLKTSFLNDIVRPGFGKRINNMLELGQNDRTWIKNHAKDRVKSFVEIRNRIAHEGRFPAKDTDEIFDNYFDMLMILPLLIFSIFGYQGAYIDLSGKYREFHERKKARQSVKKLS